MLLSHLSCVLALIVVVELLVDALVVRQAAQLVKAGLAHLLTGEVRCRAAAGRWQGRA